MGISTVRLPTSMVFLKLGIGELPHLGADVIDTLGPIENPEQRRSLPSEEFVARRQTFAKVSRRGRQNAISNGISEPGIDRLHTADHG